MATFRLLPGISDKVAATNRGHDMSCPYKEAEEEPAGSQPACSRQAAVGRPARRNKEDAGLRPGVETSQERSSTGLGHGEPPRVKPTRGAPLRDIPAAAWNLRYRALQEQVATFRLLPGISDKVAATGNGIGKVAGLPQPHNRTGLKTRHHMARKKLVPWRFHGHADLRHLRKRI